VIPAVSLVIASYNRAKILDATLENILAGNLRVEVIVVDEGSTDETERVVNS
jgi:glycosyltransferase involved in cell wall biosynthesis